MKKKLLSVLLGLVMTTGMLTGCGGSGSQDSKAEDGKTVLKMWTIATESDSFHNAYVKAIEDYETAHPDVKIEMESFENQSYKTKLKSAVAANELPDIFYTWGGGFSKSFVESGKVLALDDYYGDYKAELPQQALNNATYDGKLYGTTYTTPVSMMFYNKAMFEEQGLKAPETWDELKAVCQKFIDAGITPIGMSVKDTWVLAMTHDALTLKSAGAEKTAAALTKDGQSYNDADFLASAEKLQELIDMGAFTDGATGLSNDEAAATFTGGKSAMFITGSWLGGQIFNDAENAENYDVVPVPVCSDNAKATDFMGGAIDTLMVNADTADQDAAATAAFEIARSVSKYAYLDGAGIAAWAKDYDDSGVNVLTKKIADYTADATSFTIWFDTLMDSEDAGEYLALLQELYSGNIDPQGFAEGMDAQLSK
ncbi:ABC transporter substrate-binding protein [Anaerobium acetethylicum]|uniref:Raffinose/stachyose/melibiose transport system substrate-binding protein n=1 Tax=Anaerobium acetethylicum TaxID=1619234 RepID=A0A1D3TN93_9FIRM|nr:extracellular solute-binding protein [Anaerobium acetethylicum]SCP94775.1 raffinose/stachyose/melibiose transport system substrate-binding protein [Anaerobium acetethylicum]